MEGQHLRAPRRISQSLASEHRSTLEPTSRRLIDEVIGKAFFFFECAGRRPKIRPKMPPFRQAVGNSQRLQELDDGVLLGTFQFFKLLDDVPRLSAMSGDCVEKRKGSAVMHQSWTQADAP
jgi:hypothetical protein